MGPISKLVWTMVGIAIELNFGGCFILWQIHLQDISIDSLLYQTSYDLNKNDQHELRALRIVSLSPHQLTALSLFVTSSFSLPIDLIQVWPRPAGEDYLICCCAELDRGGCLKRSSVLDLQIALHNHFLLPTHSSQAVLCTEDEKSANRGVQSTQRLSTGPHSSSPQCSSLIYPY